MNGAEGSESMNEDSIKAVDGVNEQDEAPPPAADVCEKSDSSPAVVSDATGNESKQNGEQPAARDDEDSIEYLRAKYLGKGTASYRASVAPARKRKPLRLACDIVLLCAVIVVVLTGFIWYAAPTVEVGGVAYRSGTQNIYSFLYGANNSIFNQFKAAIDAVENISSDAEDGISSFMKLFRLTFIGAVTVYAVVDALVRLILAPVYFSNGSGAKLRVTATKAVINNLAVYVFFVFFGSVSGGVGEDAYYSGYTVGTGKTVGIIVGLCMLVAAVIIGYIENGKTVGAAEKLQMRRSIVAGACYAAIAIALTFMRIYGVFMYVLTSTLTSIVGVFVNSFDLKVLVFPLLNLTVFVSCNIIYRRASVGFAGAFMYMLSFYDRTAFDTSTPAKAKKATKAHAMSFIPVIVTSALSVIAVFLLNIPDIGFGWSVDIYPHLIAVFAISGCGQVCLSALFNDGRGKSAKRKAANAPREAADKPEPANVGA